MRILIVEDHPDLSANLRDFFSAQGHQSESAADGNAGLKLARGSQFDLIVLDRMLPRLDGDEVCRRLRAEGSNTPILMLTARDAVADRVAGLEAGADDYLVKPFAFSELAARITALDRRSRGRAGGGPLKVDDLEYDPATYRATRGGKTLPLNPTGRKLLEHLMRQTHRVVPRAELNRLLWGDTPPGPEALRVHLHALRSTVDGDFSRKLVHTVRGVGYRLALADD